MLSRDWSRLYTTASGPLGEAASQAITAVEVVVPICRLATRTFGAALGSTK
jgi:hypothetical protein